MLAVSLSQMIAHCNTKVQSPMKLAREYIICEDILTVLKSLEIRLVDSKGGANSKGKSASRRAVKKLASPIV